MDAEVVKILFVGDETCGMTTFLSYVIHMGMVLRQQASHSNPQPNISRVSAGEHVNPIPLLRDMDQPYIFEVKFGKRELRFELSDTSSPENWRTMDPDAIVICYDISQRLSLINMNRYWKDEVKKAFERRDTMPLIVLGLKRDLRSETDPNGIIYPQEAYQVAQEMRADRYVECSAVTGELLKPAFEDICKTAMEGSRISGGQSASHCSLM